MKNEKKLTDEEIVKALECCIEDDLCKACPLCAESRCIRKRNTLTLDLIHRLQSEHKRLTEEKNQSAETAVDALTQNIELQKKVDELKEERDTYKNAVSNESEAYDLGYALGYDIAVKDTAKEILQELDLFFKGTTFRKGYEFKNIEQKLKEIAKSKGVEVE